jgi:hypothetical protein
LFPVVDDELAFFGSPRVPMSCKFDPLFFTDWNTGLIANRNGRILFLRGCSCTFLDPRTSAQLIYVSTNFVDVMVIRMVVLSLMCTTK